MRHSFPVAYLSMNMNQRNRSDDAAGEMRASPMVPPLFVHPGGDGNDTLAGNIGNDVLRGENNDDLLAGGATLEELASEIARRNRPELPPCLGLVETREDWE